MISRYCFSIFECFASGFKFTLTCLLFVSLGVRGNPTLTHACMERQKQPVPEEPEPPFPMDEKLKTLAYQFQSPRALSQQFIFISIGFNALLASKGGVWQVCVGVSLYLKESTPNTLRLLILHQSMSHFLLVAFANVVYPLVFLFSNRPFYLYCN